MAFAVAASLFRLPENPPMLEGQQHLKLPNSNQHQQLPALLKLFPSSGAHPPITSARVRTGSPSWQSIARHVPRRQPAAVSAGSARASPSRKQANKLAPSSGLAVAHVARARRHPTSPSLHIPALLQPRKLLQSFKPSWALQHDRDTAFLRLSHGFPSRQSIAKPVPYLCAGLGPRLPARSTLHRVVVQTAVSSKLAHRDLDAVSSCWNSPEPGSLSRHITQTHCHGG